MAKGHEAGASSARRLNSYTEGEESSAECLPAYLVQISPSAFPPVLRGARQQSRTPDPFSHSLWVICRVLLRILHTPPEKETRCFVYKLWISLPPTWQLWVV